MYFSYGEMELDHLKKADEKLGRAIDHIGMDDLFACLVQKILGQQVSSAAQMTVWNRMLHRLGQVSPEGILSLSRNELQQLGMTYRKADHIRSLSQKVFDGTLVLDRLYGCSDSEVIRQLSSLDGIGPWTAEMVLAFCMQRPDVFSFGVSIRDCGCCTAFRKSIVSSLRNCAGAIHPAGPRQACIFGR